MVLSCDSTNDEYVDGVHIRLAGEPDGLNPILIRSGYSQQVVKKIFQPLMEFDPHTLELEPVLAVASPLVERIDTGKLMGGVAYTYEIKSEATWDDGSPVLASDVLFTYKAIFLPQVQNAFRSYLDFFRSFVIDENNTKRFTIFTDRRYFMAEVVCGNIEILPEHIYDPQKILRDFALEDLITIQESDTLFKNKMLQDISEQLLESHHTTQLDQIQGSGAYRLTEWNTGQGLRLERKTNWWGEGLNAKSLQANVKELRYSIIPDANAAISLLKEERLDVMTGIPSRQYAELQNDDYLSKKYNWSTPTQLSFMYITLNRKKKGLSDQRIRKALAFCLPVRTIIDQVMYGLAQPTVGPFAPDSEYYNDDLALIPLQLDSAKFLLAEAGWIDSNNNGIVDKKINGRLTELSLRLEIGTGSETGKAMALLFQESARKAGIDIQVQAVEFTQLIANLRKGAFDMTYMLSGYPPGEPDPSQHWYAGRENKGRSNYSGFGSAASDALIDELKQSLDKEERKKKYQKLQSMIYQDQPVLFVAVPQNKVAIHKRFKGVASQRWPGFFPQNFTFNK